MAMPHKKIIGDRIEIEGSVLRTAKGYQKDFGPEYPIGRSGKQKIIFHIIQPKYCEMLDINPDDMLATPMHPIWIEMLTKEFDSEFEKLPSEISLAERIWLAHKKAYKRGIAESVMELIRCTYMRGKLPKLVSVIRPKKSRRTTKPSMTNTKECREVLEWFADHHIGVRILGLLGTVTKSKAYAKSLYSMGAVRVVAENITKYGWGEQTGRIRVILPSQKSARKRLFKEEARYAEQNGLDPVVDVGQEFLIIGMD